MVPGKNGGTNIIYYKVLRPFFLKHQDQIDKSIGNAKEAFGKGLIFSLFKTHVAPYIRRARLLSR